LLSELRSHETARFNVEDERLVYNSQWDISISKAGRFNLDLQIPDGFDIDTLNAAQVSHWDESQTEDQRTVRIHFKHQVQGAVTLKLALSRKLGTLSVAKVMTRGGPLVVVNAYTQVFYGRQSCQVSYAAVRQAFAEVKRRYSGKSIGYPRIGAGLAGGDWGYIASIIDEELAGERHTLVRLP